MHLNLPYLFIFALAVIPQANGAITVSLPTATKGASIVIDAPIIFTITTSGNVYAIAFDEWVVSDGNQDHIFLNNVLFSYQLNGGIVSTTTVVSLLDNTAFVGVYGLSANDGYFTFGNTIAVTVGDTITILPQSIQPGFTGSKPAFNPQAEQTFTGNTFLVGVVGASRLSNLVTVPEPSASLLSSLCALALLCRRRV